MVNFWIHVYWNFFYLSSHLLPIPKVFIITFETSCVCIYIQCLIFHCRPLSRSSLARPASLSWLLRVSSPGAFLRLAGGSCHVENFNSSIYVCHANLQLQQSHTSVTGGVGNDVLVLPCIAHISEENSY